MSLLRLKSHIAFCAAILSCTAGMLCAEQTEGAKGLDPEFIHDSLYPVGVTQIRSLETFDSADVVILNTGHAGGLRLGMIVQVLRGSGNKPVADLLIVRAARDRSAALITSLSTDTILQVGDIVQVKSQSF